MDNDGDAQGLSYVGLAVRRALKFRHWVQQGECWNITCGRVVGEVAQTPPRKYWGCEEILPETSHSDGLPKRMCDVIKKAHIWVDIASLGPPDGKFRDMMNDAVRALAAKANESGRKITVRMLFGNIIGMPVDCWGVVDRLLQGVPPGSNIELWVGAWRKGLSWNHAKFIAVDGKHLFQGGHNLWDAHYLQTDPVRDVSMEADGLIARDAHKFANAMWQFIIAQDRRRCLMKLLPGWMLWFADARIEIARWPRSAEHHPPMYVPMIAVFAKGAANEEEKDGQNQRASLGRTFARRGALLETGSNAEPGVPMISCGRYGGLHHFSFTANPSDSAIAAMIGSAKTVIRMSLQDLGPFCLPLPGGMLQAIPGGIWPEEYLRELGLAIYDRGVDIDLVLSNPNAVPGNLNPLVANYGNGWLCTDVASEVIKAIKQHRPDASHDRLRQVMRDNLRVTYVRSKKQCDVWPDSGRAMGNHAKFFIVDDICYYLGSQNLYIANLAEWGVIVDDEAATRRVLHEYWKPMWEQSYTGEDCDVDLVMDGLHINRSGEEQKSATTEKLALMLRVQRRSFSVAEGMVCFDSREIERTYNVDEQTTTTSFNGEGLPAMQQHISTEGSVRWTWGLHLWRRVRAWRPEKPRSPVDVVCSASPSLATGLEATVSIEMEGRSSSSSVFGMAP